MFNNFWTSKWNSLQCSTRKFHERHHEGSDPICLLQELKISSKNPTAEKKEKKHKFSNKTHLNEKIAIQNEANSLQITQQIKSIINSQTFTIRITFLPKLLLIQRNVGNSTNQKSITKRVNY